MAKRSELEQELEAIRAKLERLEDVLLASPLTGRPRSNKTRAAACSRLAEVVPRLESLADDYRRAQRRLSSAERQPQSAFAR